MEPARIARGRWSSVRGPASRSWEAPRPASTCGIATTCAGESPFAGLGTAFDETGVPYLVDALAYLSCRVLGDATRGLDRRSAAHNVRAFAVHPGGQGIYDRSLAASGDLRALAEGRVDFLLAQPADPLVRAEVVETMAAIDPGAYRIGAEAVWLADQRERASAIDVPALVLCGTADKATPPELSAALADLVPNADLALIDGAGHLANLERPAEFNREIDRFLSAMEQKK